jgi:hypothetical protein
MPRPVLLVGDEMRERGQRPRLVEAATHVRHRVVQPAARLDLAQVSPQRAKRVLAVLEHMVRDQKVDRRVADFRELLAIVDHRDRNEGPRVELRILVRQLRDGAVIDVTGGRVLRQRRRRIERADLDATPAQVSRGDAFSFGDDVVGQRHGGLNYA